MKEILISVTYFQWREGETERDSERDGERHKLRETERARAKKRE